MPYVNINLPLKQIKRVNFVRYDKSSSPSIYTIPGGKIYRTVEAIHCANHVQAERLLLRQDLVEATLYRDSPPIAVIESIIQQPQRFCFLFHRTTNYLTDNLAKWESISHFFDRFITVSSLIILGSYEGQGDDIELILAHFILYYLVSL